MADPYEGIAPDGTIQTGARRDRVPAIFEPVLADAVTLLGPSEASLYVYGSVVTGGARPGSSDVDLLSIHLQEAAGISARLSRLYADRCRGVEVAAAAAADFVGDTDAAYGNRVFLRHYCVHLAGPDPSSTLPAFPADARRPAVSTATSTGTSGDGRKRWRPAPTLRTSLVCASPARPSWLLPGWSAFMTTRGRPTGHGRCGAGVRSTLVSPPHWLGCTPGPTELSAPRLDKSRRWLPMMASSPRSSNSSPA